MGPDIAIACVFSQLQKLFPQVDNRALKAVAIEHRKDVDAAALAVLNEIIPHLSDNSTPASPLARSISDESSHASVVAVAVSKTEDNPSESRVGSIEVRDSPNVLSGLFHDEAKQKAFNEAKQKALKIMRKTREKRVKKIANASCSNVAPKTEGAISVAKSPESSSKENSPFTPVFMFGLPQTVHKDVDQNDNLNEKSVVGSEESVVEKSCADSDNLLTSAKSCSLEESKTEEAISVGKSPESCSKELPNCTPWYKLVSPQDVQIAADQVANLIDEVGDIVAETDSGNEKRDDLEKSCENGDNPVIEALDDVTAAGSQLEAAEKVEENTMSSTESQSSQILALDEILANARNNKDTYFSELEAITGLMRKVELRKQDAVKAKEEAAKGGEHIQNRVEELTQMLLRAQEANDMHSGEVFGEKSILATELKELQSRVLSISDERDKSLAVLVEMRQSLELQLAAAEDEIRSAEQEKLEKESAAQKLLADQEMIMAKVVQEAKMLKEQAEDNAKLQEFLLDRGCVVDKLQGEIALMSQDVRLLKERFDANVPLSQSISSIETSQSVSSIETSLILASPKSSVAMEIDHPETQQKSDNEQVREQTYEEARYDHGLLIEDGWELCEDDEISA